MKTSWLSFFILYAVCNTEAKRLRGLIAAMTIYDQRESIKQPPDDGTFTIQGNGHKFTPPFLNTSGKSRYNGHQQD